MWGFAAIAVFMIIYYQMFGVVSVLALASNLLFLVAILSLLQATLTLPGIAAIALTLGMAIDANVLINERVREELRAGMPPQAAISEGYERAFGTILDSNITTLIAGLGALAVAQMRQPDEEVARRAEVLHLGFAQPRLGEHVAYRFERNGLAGAYFHQGAAGEFDGEVQPAQGEKEYGGHESEERHGVEPQGVPHEGDVLARME